MKKNNKGFTLVELLAVIVIMGILMMVAIPSVTRTIENSRKDTFVDIAKSYGNAARTLWTSDNLTCNGVVSSAVDDGDYYILINSKEGAKDSLPVLVDQGGKSSWGNRDVNGYVRVNISTIPGEDNDMDGFYEVEPRRVTKFYVALSDGTHGLIDDDTVAMDSLVRGNVNMTLSEDDLKKIELTVDDGRLDCGRDANGVYSCAEVTPIKNITGICVDDQTNVGLTGNVGVPGGDDDDDDDEIIGISFRDDSWETISTALNSNSYQYRVGDEKVVNLDVYGTHTVRISNLTPCDGSLESETACGAVIEFVDIIDSYNYDEWGWNALGWPESSIRTYLNDVIYNSLPADLKNVIIDTKVISGRANYGTNFETYDKLYLLSSKEISGIAQNDSLNVETRRLDYYVTNLNLIKKYSSANYRWWLRSAYTGDDASYTVVYSTGEIKYDDAHVTGGISPAFKIA